MIAAWMAYATLVAAFVCLAAMTAERALRLSRRPARWAWVGAMSLACLVPLAAIRRAPVAPTPRAAATSGAVLHSTAGELSSSVVVIPQISSPITVARGSAISEFDRPLRRAWLAASLVWCVVLVASGVRVTQRRRHWRASVVDGVPVLISRDVGPAVVGIVRSQIVIPAWVSTLAPEQRALVLAHEREHARARDPLLLAAGALTLVAMPWNAALWYALSRLRLAVEADCDRRVLRAHPDAHAYSSLLVDVTERNLTNTLHLAALGASRSQLARRLALLTARTPRHLAPRVLGATLFSLTCVVGACKTPQPAVVAQDLGIRPGLHSEATTRTVTPVVSGDDAATDRTSTSEPRAIRRFAKDSSALNATHVLSSARQAALSAFSLVITTMPTGWAAHCDSGCHWQEVAYSCPGNCRAVFDANGVSTPRARRADASEFAFELQRVDGETRARSLAGTAWKALSWGCPTDTCRARIDANGVRGVRTGAAADSVTTGWLRSQPAPAVRDGRSTTLAVDPTVQSGSSSPHWPASCAAQQDAFADTTRAYARRLHPEAFSPSVRDSSMLVGLVFNERCQLLHHAAGRRTKSRMDVDAALAQLFPGKRVSPWTTSGFAAVGSGEHNPWIAWAVLAP
jgi:beta-lactamase regulating signal transducer with metallopeptidase domain